MIPPTDRGASGRILPAAPYIEFIHLPSIVSRAADAMVMMGLPSVNQRIALRADTGDEFASRVEDVGGTRLTVARPLDLPAEHELRIGSEIMAAWHVDDGVHVLPCKVTRIRREGVVPLWDVEVMGEPWREQRRSFVRAAVMGRVAMHWTTIDEVEREATGLISDLSEAAVGFVSKDRVLETSAPAGITAEISIKTPGQHFELEGEIVRATALLAQAPSTDPAQWQVVVRFSNPGRTADDIRRIVFNQQLRDRHGR
jgi:c-di-GMP-binding flagellar brake protein YcgR